MVARCAKFVWFAAGARSATSWVNAVAPAGRAPEHADFAEKSKSRARTDRSAAREPPPTPRDADDEGRFLDSSAAPTVSTSEALEAQLESVIKGQPELRLREAPEEQPYVHRYEERELLQKLSTRRRRTRRPPPTRSARARPSSAASPTGCSARISWTPRSRQRAAALEAAVAALDGSGGRGGGVDRRAQPPRRARGEQRRAREGARAPPPRRGGARGAAGAGNNTADAQRLDDAQTLTTFYLAQVCGALGRSHEAAAYCHATMQRQLARRGVGGGGEHAFVALEWAKNAASIATYYAGVHRYDVAEHCLRPPPPPSSRSTARAPPPAAAAAERTYLTGNGEAEGRRRRRRRRQRAS